jgi:histidinol-phosphatase (PHP family)
MHSEWSFDTMSSASMLATCQRAVALGLPAVAFTEHLEWTDWQPGDEAATVAPRLDWWPLIEPIDVTGYFAGLAECRDRFPGLRVVSGLEIGEPHLFEASVKAFLGTGRFDRLLGSLHAIPWDGGLAGPGAMWPRLPAEEFMRRYFAELLTMVEAGGDFEVLAHVDYPRRYWPSGPDRYQEADYQEEYRAVFQALAASGRVLEFNTKSPFASLAQLGWWREAGGRAISFGSDGHLPSLVGKRFAEAMAVAETAGFRPGRDRYDFWRCGG